MVLLIGAFFLCGILYFAQNVGQKKEAVVTESFADQSGETKSSKGTSDSKTEAVVYIYICGEVKNPGRFVIDHDKVTILDALSQAGDLTIYGRRDNVLVMRQEGKTQNVYRIDLANADQLYSSPVFYLQQNDVIYVEPNTRRAKEATELGISFSNPSLWLSAASLLTTISVLIFKN